MTDKYATSSEFQSWRDLLPIHPAALLLPRMSDAELKELGADIAATVQQLPEIILLNDDGREELLDGLNRLDAMERAGIEVAKDGVFNRDRVPHQHVRGNTDPYAFVLSAILHRRHLTQRVKKLLRSVAFADGTTVDVSEIWTINYMPANLDITGIDRSQSQQVAGFDGETLREMIRNNYHCRSRAEEDYFLARWIAS
jgi:hypothetical protein